MSVVRWTLSDPETSDSYTFEINPNDGGSPTYQKAFQYQATAAPDGKTLIFEGRDQPQKIEFSGTILSQEHYEAFVEWFKDRNQVVLTDDLDRQFTIIIESFAPARKRSALYPWKHTFRMSATLTVPA